MLQAPALKEDGVTGLVAGIHLETRGGIERDPFGWHSHAPPAWYLQMLLKALSGRQPGGGEQDTKQPKSLIVNGKAGANKVPAILLGFPRRDGRRNAHPLPE